MQQNRFWPDGGAYSISRPSSWIKGVLLLREGRGRQGEEEGRGKRKGVEGKRREGQ